MYNKAKEEAKRRKENRSLFSAPGKRSEPDWDKLDFKDQSAILQEQPIKECSSDLIEFREQLKADIMGEEIAHFWYGERSNIAKAMDLPDLG